jgi:hypothetical protein
MDLGYLAKNKGFRAISVTRPHIRKAYRQIRSDLNTRPYLHGICKSLDLSFGGIDISMPDIDGDLKSVETELGASFNVRFKGISALLV